MKTRTIALGLSALVAASAQLFTMAGVAGHIAPASLARAKAELHRAIKAGEIAGGMHLVWQDGKVVYLEVAGVRDIEDKTPLQADAILRIYSMSKPIVSVAAMTLHEQGKFQLDDPVSKFIPAFARTTVLVKDGDTNKVVPARRPISVRDVFRHTTGYSYGDEPAVRAHYERAGLRYWGPAEMFPPRMTTEQAVEVLARIPALHHPGERFTYGFNTDLLGRLIEVWSGCTLEVFLRETIFEPLEMADTGFSVPSGKRDRFASCHTLRDGKLIVLDKAADSPFSDGFEFVSGGGGLVSTIRDYANFCQTLVEGGQFKGKPLLKEETLKLMFTDQLKGVAGDFRFGLGFAIGDVTLGSEDRPRKAVQYSWGGYASTDFRIVPEAKFFQIVMRQEVPASNDLANRLFAMMYAGLEAPAERSSGGPTHTDVRTRPHPRSPTVP